MNNKTILWVVVGVIVVAGIVFLMVDRPVAAPGGGTTVAGSATQAPAASPMSLKGLLAAGTSQKCTFTNTNADGTQSNGTVYVSAGHMRGDFTAQTSAGQTITSHMITDGTTSWMWTDQSAQGMKMSFSSMSMSSGTPSQPSQTQSHTIDPNAQMNYSCSGWTVDQSEFAVPTNITFTDMSAMMQGAAGANPGAAAGAAGAAAGASGNSAMCAQCNAIPSASGKASCLAALGCK